MNIKAIWETVEYMEKEPARIDMIDGIVSASEAMNYDTHSPYFQVKRILVLPPCDTVSCIAGAAVLSHRDIKKSDLDMWHSWYRVRDEAEEILDLSSGEAARLFYLPTIHGGSGGDDAWPDSYEKAYFEAKTPEDRAKVIRERIQHFIDTNGAE